ncbi:hypothetical protein [Actinoplanes sp. NPDC049681]|uniref:hypothetical protein n=1 Tax=Actinoplanes sp. NPDC049681 TaxID=3363905 RepID=UPI0037B0FD25
MRKSHTSVVLAALLLTGIAGCKDDGRTSAASPASASPSASVSAPASPDASAPGTSAPATSEAAAPQPSSPAADPTFPLTVARRGGFAGVDERATIAADGSAMVTLQGRAPVRKAVPAATLDELRRLLNSPDFARQAKPTAVCNDGYEYEFASRSSTKVVHDCGASQGAAVDRTLAIAASLFKR